MARSSMMVFPVIRNDTSVVIGIGSTPDGMMALTATYVAANTPQWAAGRWVRLSDHAFQYGEYNEASHGYNLRYFCNAYNLDAVGAI